MTCGETRTASSQHYTLTTRTLAQHRPSTPEYEKESTVFPASEIMLKHCGYA